MILYTYTIFLKSKRFSEILYGVLRDTKRSFLLLYQILNNGLRGDYRNDYKFNEVGYENINF